MKSLLEEIEAVGSALQEVTRDPLAPRVEGVAEVIQHLEALLGESASGRVRQLPSSQRASFARGFQAVADRLRAMRDVGEQVEQLGGQASWALAFAEAVGRMERQLKRLGLPLGPSKSPPPKVVRDSATGEFRVFDSADLDLLAASTSATTTLVSALFRTMSQTRPPSETGPTTIKNLRRMLMAVTPERLKHLDAQRASLAARMLDQTYEDVRNFMARAGQLGHEDEAWFKELTRLFGQLESAVESLLSSLDVEAARAALAESDERIPYEQVRRELGL